MEAGWVYFWLSWRRALGMVFPSFTPQFKTGVPDLRPHHNVEAVSSGLVVCVVEVWVDIAFTSGIAAGLHDQRPY
jgi:hypothetical protein